MEVSSIGFASLARRFFFCLTLFSLSNAQIAYLNQSTVGYWSFAVRDGNSVVVVYPSQWIPYPDEALSFSIQKSISGDFAEFEEITTGQQILNAQLYAVFDGWNGTDVYYRVLVMFDGTLIGASQASRPFDQSKGLFVVPGEDDENSQPCGNFLTNPCLSLRSAIENTGPEDTIFVVPGIYSGQRNTDIVIDTKPLLLTSTNGPEYTLINCTDPLTGSRSRAFSFDSPQTNGSLIQGFAITGGSSDFGGCISIQNSSPILSNMYFAECFALTGVARGGAIYIDGPQAKPSVIGSGFLYNQANEGGAIMVANYASLNIEYSSIEFGICGFGTGLGGGIYTLMANLNIESTEVKNCIAGFSGAGIMVEASNATLRSSVVEKNIVANTGGGITVYGASMEVEDSEIVENYSTVFAGGVMVTNSNFLVRNSIVSRNIAQQAGAGIKVVGGIAQIFSSQINDNMAKDYGAAFDITTQGILSAVKTIVYVNDSEISNNWATHRGAAFLLDALDEFRVSNSIIRNNSASKGGAVWCGSENAANFENVLVEANKAMEGGGLFLEYPCKIKIKDSILSTNKASKRGAAIASSEGSEIWLDRSELIGNGRQDCVSGDTPESGGAIAVGIASFKIESGCQKAASPKSAMLNITDSKLLDNESKYHGGAIAIESGKISAHRMSVRGNKVGTPGSRSGYGGGISIEERCVEDECAMTSVNITESEFISNIAHLAGGGLYAAGSSLGSLYLKDSRFVNNSASSEVTMGFGGGIYIAKQLFNLTYIQIANNSAYLGGGMYLSTDLSNRSASFLDNVFAAYNLADAGYDVFWEKSKSPDGIFDTSKINTLSSSPHSISTESLSVSFISSPPDTIKSGEDITLFRTQLVDYYGAISRTDTGECMVVNSEDEIGDLEPSIRPLGSSVPIGNGAATFGQLSVTGEIGKTYNFQVQCSKRVESISGLYLFENLPPAEFEAKIAECDPGYTPAEAGIGDICIECRYGTYNVDGEACKTCPEGATCPGGSLLLSESNWWRSGDTSVNLYECRFPDVCLPGPSSGDDACSAGHQGPLCAVCKPDWFLFAGKCRECNHKGRYKIIISIAAIILGIIIILLFARSWDFGDPGSPGMLSKVKILIMHFQMLSLLKEYDILWPPETSEGFSWFGLLNFGPSMLAPKCWIGNDFNYWARWITQMSLPLLVIIFCIGIFKLAHSIKNYLEENDSSSKNEKIIAWLEGLKLRCWKNCFWLITLLYPASCLVALEMFATQTLDIGTYLSADFSIKIKDPGGGFSSTYIKYMIPGAILLAVLSIGVPLFCFLAIWTHRMQLNDTIVAKKFGFLYGSYDRKYPYWETVQMLRRFIFAFIPVFIKPNANGSVQGTVAQVASIVLLVSTVWLRPFANALDNNLEISSQIVLNLLLISGCAVTWADISSEGMTAFGVIQLFLSSVIAFIVGASVTIGVVKLAKGYLAEKQKKCASAYVSAEDQEAASSENKKEKKQQTDEIQVHIETFN